MNFLYAVKGCSHCDSREYCPTELKNSETNLVKQLRYIEERRRKWFSFCSDFYRRII